MITLFLTQPKLNRVYMNDGEKLNSKSLDIRVVGLGFDSEKGPFVDECNKRSVVGCKGCANKFKCPVSLHERLG